MSHPISDMMSDSMAKIRQMVDANTVIGDPINTPQGVTLIPVSKISCGYAGGGTEFSAKQPSTENPFGGGSGCSIKITPVAFMVIKGDNVRMMPVTEAPSSSADRLIELIPDLVDYISKLRNQKKDVVPAEDAEI